MQRDPDHKKLGHQRSGITPTWPPEAGAVGFFHELRNESWVSLFLYPMAAAATATRHHSSHHHLRLGAPRVRAY